MHLLKAADSPAAATGPLPQSAYYYYTIVAAVYNIIILCRCLCRIVRRRRTIILCSGRPLLHCRKWSKYLSRFN